MRSQNTLLHGGFTLPCQSLYLHSSSAVCRSFLNAILRKKLYICIVLLDIQYFIRWLLLSGKCSKMSFWSFCYIHQWSRCSSRKLNVTGWDYNRISISRLGHEILVSFLNVFFEVVWFNIITIFLLRNRPSPLTLPMLLLKLDLLIANIQMLLQLRQQRYRLSFLLDGFSLSAFNEWLFLEM